MAEKAELIITALQERIGQLVAGYETQIAILRAELTKLSNDELERKNAVEKYSEEISKVVE
jgi:hypothetical protein